MIHNLLKMMKEVSHNSGGENVRFGAGLPRINDGSPLWAWMGAMGVAAVNGIVSPAYNVYQPGDRLDRPGCLGMNALQPWSGFDRLGDALAAVQVKSRDTAARSVDEILTLRNWLIGALIVAYEQEGEDRARYGEGLVDALAAAFKGRGVSGLSGRNLRNYRQIPQTWPRLGIRQTQSGESRLPIEIWQTLFAELLPVGSSPTGPSTFIGVLECASTI